MTVEHLSGIVTKYMGQNLNLGLLTPKLSIFPISFGVCGLFRLDEKADSHLHYVAPLFPVGRCLFKELKQTHSEGDGDQDSH